MPAPSKPTAKAQRSEIQRNPFFIKEKSLHYAVFFHALQPFTWCSFTTFNLIIWGKELKTIEGWAKSWEAVDLSLCTQSIWGSLKQFHCLHSGLLSGLFISKSILWLIQVVAECDQKVKGPLLSPSLAEYTFFPSQKPLGCRIMYSYFYSISFLSWWHT